MIVDHGNGYRTLYWHLSEILVAPGPIQRGAPLGIVGASGCVTGPHLHFQVQFLGRDTDPYGWCGPDGQDPWANHPAGSASTWLWSWMPSPCALPADTIMVEPGDPTWRNRGPGWEEVAGGVGGSVIRATTVSAQSRDLPNAVWIPVLPADGEYRVMTWVPYIRNGIADFDRRALSDPPCRWRICGGDRSFSDREYLGRSRCLPFRAGCWTLCWPPSRQPRARYKHVVRRDDLASDRIASRNNTLPIRERTNRCSEVPPSRNSMIWFLLVQLCSCLIADS